MVVHDRIYKGRCASLATMHNKLALIAPHMETELGLTVFEAPINTDLFGTFSGEIERTETPYRTAELKALAGMSHLGTDVGLASEGSIGVSGMIPVVSDLEIVLIIDQKEDFVLAESDLSFQTITHSWILGHEEVSPVDLKKAGFPEHGLIVRAEDAESPVFKGIHEIDSLSKAIASCRLLGHENLIIESDLRANHSPSRRSVISSAAKRLSKRLRTQCEVCSCPGWGPIDSLEGRPCRLCRNPTRGRLATVFGCCRCGLKVTGPIDESFADPATCEFCNP